MAASQHAHGYNATDRPGMRLCYLSMVAGQLQKQLPAIRIPVLEQPVLAHGEDVVRVGNESDLRVSESMVDDIDSSE